MAEFKNILLIGFAGIGDTLLTTPAIRLLRERFPNSKITAFVVSSSTRTVLEGNPDIDELICEKGVWKNPLKLVKTIKRIRCRGVDTVVTFYPSSRILYAILAFTSGAQCRIIHDYPRDYFRKLKFLHNIRVPIHAGKHSVLQNTTLLKPLSINKVSEKDLHLKLHIPEKQALSARKYLLESGLKVDDTIIGLNPGSGGMEYKRWPLKNYISLARMLSDSLGVKPVFFCGPNEEDIVEKIVSRNFTVFEGLSLLETAALIGNCRLFITNDSGLMHVAVSHSVPVVGVFGPTDPGKTGPFTEKKKEVVSNLDCSPCYDPASHRKFNCIYGHSKCLEEISVNQVYSEAADLLSLE